MMEPLLEPTRHRSCRIAPSVAAIYVRTVAARNGTSISAVSSLSMISACGLILRRYHPVRVTAAIDVDVIAVSAVPHLHDRDVALDCGSFASDRCGCPELKGKDCCGGCAGQWHVQFLPWLVGTKRHKPARFPGRNEFHNWLSGIHRLFIYGIGDGQHPLAGLLIFVMVGRRQDAVLIRLGQRGLRLLESNVAFLLNGSLLECNHLTFRLSELGSGLLISSDKERCRPEHKDCNARCHLILGGVGYPACLRERPRARKLTALPAQAATVVRLVLKEARHRPA